MQSPCTREVSQVCFNGCYPSQFFHFPEPPESKPRNTSSTSRHDFAAKTASSFFPNTLFTNPESLPSLEESSNQFNKAYPQYSKTNQIDKIRAIEYPHLSLSNHVCLDYIGIGLFSRLQFQEAVGSSSSPHHNSGVPFFTVSYKSTNLKTQLLYGGHESELESSIKKRIMDYLNISENEYSMVLTANRTSAFKILAESYSFKCSKKLLTVYDYESEAVKGLISCSEKRGAKAMSAEFKWPRLKINSAKLKKMLSSNGNKKENGLFVFPLQSRMSGARYPYLWMRIAQENGWRVLLDACALGPKDMDCFGLSLVRPDFIICSFYKLFGENPSGFGCLLVKKSTVPLLETSVCAGIVTLKKPSGADTELDQVPKFAMQDDIKELENHESIQENNKILETKCLEIKCSGLDHVDSLGLVMISNRARYLINWLVNALMKLHHPCTTAKMPLVKIYGPKIRFDRAPAVAFNIFDWKGDKVEPVLIQKLADRSNISLNYGFLHELWFTNKYQEEKERVVERRESKKPGNKRNSVGITVVTLALGFLANFEDIYRLWVFLAQFLDADFVEKERWRYTALNQKTIEI